MTQFDVEYVLNIEKRIGKKLEEFKTKEDDVLRHINETITAKALVTVRLKEAGFGEKKKKRKEKEEQRKESKMS